MAGADGTWALAARGAAERYVAELLWRQAATDEMYELAADAAKALSRNAPSTPPATSLARAPRRIESKAAPLEETPKIPASKTGERRMSAASRLLRLLEPRNEPSPPRPLGQTSIMRKLRSNTPPMTPPQEQQQSQSSTASLPEQPAAEPAQNSPAPVKTVAREVTPMVSKVDETRTSVVTPTPPPHPPPRPLSGRSANMRRRKQARRLHSPSCPFCADKAARKSAAKCPTHEVEEPLSPSMTMERRSSMRAALLRRLSTQDSLPEKSMARTPSGGNEVKRGLRKMLRSEASLHVPLMPAAAPDLKEKSGLNESWELHHIARELCMSVDDVVLVKRVFDAFDVDRSNALSEGEFEMAICQLLQVQVADGAVPPERVKAISQWHWWDSDKDGSGSIDFREFVRWYSSNGFSEELLLDDNERWLRKLAKRHEISATYVESIKRHFDKFDTDKSGAIDKEEFSKILHKILKIPGHLELPETRVQFYWSEIDADSSGTALFEEFLAWWLRYFEEAKPRKGKVEAGNKVAPFEAFYRNIRRIGAEHLDPLVYQQELEEDEEEQMQDTSMWGSITREARRSMRDSSRAKSKTSSLPPVG